MTQQSIDAPKLAHAYKWLVMWFGAQLVLAIARPLINAIALSLKATRACGRTESRSGCWVLA